MINIEKQFNTSRLTLILIFSGLLILGLYWDTFLDLVKRWDAQEEYSHGYLIPCLTAYFIWLRRYDLQSVEFKPSWWGGVLVLMALLFFAIGTVSILYIVLDYSLIILLVGLCWSLMGTQALKIILLPLLMLIFAIPLPAYLETILSAKLQLLSSKLGVDFIRFCNIPVYLEGNVIDLGVYKLQVVEACSGLRYLFPLMSLGFICAYMYEAPFWKRIVVFLSSIPITIIMNSFRIGVVGLLVDKWGIEMAEGFLHDFEGWVVFMVCLTVLILEIFLFTIFSKDPRPFSEVFGLVVTEPETDLHRTVSNPGMPFLVSVALITVSLGVLTIAGKREEVIPERVEFSAFPLQIENWQGRRAALTEDELRMLKLTDYILVDYFKPNQPRINFYSAYYQSQKRSVVPHSPRVCIPGGGWEIADISRKVIDGYPVNRMIIKKGENKQLVYYWYQLHGDVVANEFKMKWALFKGAVLLNRSDGALVRLITDIGKSDTIADADQRLEGFMSEIMPHIKRYIPV